MEHKFNPLPSVDLVEYLVAQRAANVLYICHSFSDAPDRRSSYVWFRSGVLCDQKQTKDYRLLPEPLLYVKELFFTLAWVGKSRVTWDHYIGMDGLCTGFGLILRMVRRVTSVKFWSIDLVPRGRFRQRWKDGIYRRVNRLSALWADEVWDLSERMFHERERVLGVRPTDYRRRRLVPFGVWSERIARHSYAECDQHVLVFIGHLLEKQGVQLVLQAIPRIAERIPNFRFDIIGEGAYEAPLRLLASELKVEQHVRFLGRISDDEGAHRLMSRCAAGIAPYVRSLDTFTQFADPGKIKTYLVCGLPVLVTDVPWIAPEIEKRECGWIISEDTGDIEQKIIRVLVDGEINQAFRANAARYAEEFDYRRIFDALEL